MKTSHCLPKDFCQLVSRQQRAHYVAQSFPGSVVHVISQNPKPYPFLRASTSLFFFLTTNIDTTINSIILIVAALASYYSSLVLFREIPFSLKCWPLAAFLLLYPPFLSFFFFKACCLASHPRHYVLPSRMLIAIVLSPTVKPRFYERMAPSTRDLRHRDSQLVTNVYLGLISISSRYRAYSR